MGTPNGALMEFVADYLRAHDVPFTLLKGPEGDRYNLFATIGDASVPGYILSGHVDVVPAQEPEWQADPFVMRHADGRLIGRGCCDMKGYVAAALAAVPALQKMNLSAPVHIALSYDEEAGCRGVPHMLAALPDLCAAPLGCIVGEPTGLVPVLAHKGKAALRLLSEGRAGHSSRPDLGANAIHGLLPALLAATTQAKALEAGPQDPRFAPPYSSLQIGTLKGGQAINIIPEAAQAEIEARAIAGVDPQTLLAPVLDALGEGVRGEWMSTYPALALGCDHPLAHPCRGHIRQCAPGRCQLRDRSGVCPPGGRGVNICGPGEIARAHAPRNT